MSRSAGLRSRSARAVSLGFLVAVLSTYLLIGHALHAPNDGMKPMHGEGTCLVLFVLALGFTVARLRQAPPRRTERAARTLAPVAAVRRAAAAPMPARASPAWLQIFRR